MFLLKKTKFLLLVLILFFFLHSTSYAQMNQPSTVKEERFEAVITSVKKETIIDVDNKEKLNLILEVKGLEGKFKGQKIPIQNLSIQLTNIPNYQLGDKVIVSSTKTPDGKSNFFIVDYVRRAPLYWLLAIFVVSTIVVGRKTGLGSLIGLGFSFLVIFLFILPQISQGRDPTTIVIIGSIFIIPITYYLSHGFSKKTNFAIISTIIALVLSGILANFFIDASRLTGFVSEEANFLQAMKPNLINIKGLLLAGIIIGIIGVIDDITISQAAIVCQLKEASPKITFSELYRRAMSVGRDHIASMVNTLVLVYTGAAMPLLILFIDNPYPFAQIINQEIITEEIIRTLTASIGLIFAVPITTFLTALFIDFKIKSKTIN